MEDTGHEPTSFTSTRRGLLSAAAAAVPLAVSVPLLQSPALADDNVADGPGRPAFAQPPERDLRRMLAEVDQHRIEATNTLVSFGTPKGVQIVAQVLTNQTTLQWTRGTEPDLAGYEVLWRETTSPVWTHVIRVGDVTTTTVDLAKDNVHFGVRAVDTSGHRGPVAYPVSV